MNYSSFRNLTWWAEALSGLFSQLAGISSHSSKDANAKDLGIKMLANGSTYYTLFIYKILIHHSRN